MKVDVANLILEAVELSEKANKSKKALKEWEEKYGESFLYEIVNDLIYKYCKLK